MQRRFLDDLGIRKSPTPKPVRPVSMINYPPHINIYENFNANQPLDPNLNLPPVVPRNEGKTEIPTDGNLTRESNYSLVRRPRMCSGDTPTTPTNNPNTESQYDLAKLPFPDDPNVSDRPLSDPYLAMSECDKNKTLTKQPVNVHELDDGYQAIRSDDESNLFDYEVMSCDTKSHMRVLLPSHGEGKRQSGQSDASSTNRDSGSVFEGSRNSSSKEENLYAPFPVDNPSSNSENIPDLPPPRLSGSESPKCSSPEKPPRSKKGSVFSPPHSNRNSGEQSAVSDAPSPQPPPLESLPVRRTLQDVLSSDFPSSNYPPKVGGHARSLTDLYRSDDPDRGNIYSVQPLPPTRKNIPPLTDYAFVKPKSEDRSEIPQLPPPRRQVSNRTEVKGPQSPPLQSFKFKPGISEPSVSAESQDDSDEYEDATMMNGQPPRPPPRRSTKPHLNKSKSYHNAEEQAQITQDDIPMRPRS